MMLAAASSHGTVIPQPESIAPTAAVTINITARSFSFTPNQFSVNQGDAVTININVPSNDPSTIGHGMRMDTYVDNGVNVPRGSSRTITFTATTAGTFPWICTQPTCGTGHTSMFGQMIVNAVSSPPSISSIFPISGSTAGGTTVIISGANFQSGATVQFGTTAATSVNVTSSTSISTVTPAHAAGTVGVTVTSGGQSATLANAFTYIAPGPSIASISPNTGPTSGGTAVTITGSGFQSGATLTIGLGAAGNVTVVNSTTITALTPIGPSSEQAALPVDIVARNLDGTTATKSAAFTYSPAPLTITSVTPSTAPPAGGAVVNISGTGFTSALPSSVTFGGVAANARVIDAVTIQATVPAHAAGAVDVAVTVGGTSVKKTAGFTYQDPQPRHRSARH